jgi:serine/threonine protein kinase
LSSLCALLAASSSSAAGGRRRKKKKKKKKKKKQQQQKKKGIMAWNEVNEVDASKGIYTVCGKLWLVGPRYKLQGHIGSGTYGDVCKAIDLEFNQIIALKRVPDIFYCHMLAKRVLREVCIMRRLCHPYIISLTNVFTTQNLESSDTTDLYIATEFAERCNSYNQFQELNILIGQQSFFFVFEIYSLCRKTLQSVSVHKRGFRSRCTY